MPPHFMLHVFNQEATICVMQDCTGHGNDVTMEFPFGLDRNWMMVASRHSLQWSPFQQCELSRWRSIYVLPRAHRRPIGHTIAPGLLPLARVLLAARIRSYQTWNLYQIDAFIMARKSGTSSVPNRPSFAIRDLVSG